MQKKLRILPAHNMRFSAMLAEEYVLIVLSATQLQFGPNE